MKKVLFIILIILLVVTMSLAVFLLKKTRGTKQSPNSEETKSSENVLYDYLQENGRLVNGEDLVLESGNFVLSTDHSRKMYAVNNILDYNGYDVTVRLPLFEKGKKVTVVITVENETSLSEIRCTVNPSDFTLKTPLDYEVGIESPPIKVIYLKDTSTMNEEEIKEYKKENREKEQYNIEVEEQRAVREQIAKELSHEAIGAILDWLSKELPVNTHELGYVNFQD